MKTPFSSIALQRISLLTFVGVFVLCAASSRAASVARTNNVTIATTTGASTYNVGAQIFLKVTVTNNLSTTIQIPDDVRNFTITVTTASGQAVRPKFIPSRGYFGPGQPNARLTSSSLQSGASFTYSSPFSTIDDGFILDQAGAYNISIGHYYMDPSSSSLRVTLQSNTLQVTMQ
jgi:hypothetical protein